MTFLPCATRQEANDPRTVAVIENATGIFFTGGDQTRIATSVRIPSQGNGPIALTGAQLHVLPAGYAFELTTRTPVVNGAPAGTRARDRGE